MMMVRLLFFIIAFVFFQITGIGQEILFEDKFEGNLKPGWSWLRGDTSAWRFAGNGLEIQVEPNDENEAKNVLVRPTDFIGRGTVCIETELTFLSKPENQYQQGGICWLQNGRVIFKLVHELVDGKMYIFPGKVPVESDTVKLRILTCGNDIIAEFCNGGESSYRRIYEGKLGITRTDQISLQCWNGPRSRKHWMRFHYFRIIKVSD